jgi:uncharacterized protein (TIGR02266 family)
MADYWVGDQAGRRLGPVGFEVLRDLINSGRLVWLDKVSRDGATFRPLAEFPEIAALFAQRRPPGEPGEAQRVLREIGALKSKPISEVFGLSPGDPIDAYRAAFFALVRRFYPERIPKEVNPELRHAYGEMFHFLSRLMAQVEALNARATQAFSPSRVASAPPSQPKDFIGWERGVDNRVYCQVECNRQNVAAIFMGHKLANISTGGFFLGTARTPALGDAVQITMKFDAPRREIVANASVVVESHVDDPRVPRGFGCRFTRLSDDDKKFIQDFVRDAAVANAAAR